LIGNVELYSNNIKLPNCCEINRINQKAIVFSGIDSLTSIDGLCLYTFSQLKNNFYRINQIFYISYIFFIFYTYQYILSNFKYIYYILTLKELSLENVPLSLKSIYAFLIIFTFSKFLNPIYYFISHQIVYYNDNYVKGKGEFESLKNSIIKISDSVKFNLLGDGYDSILLSAFPTTYQRIKN